MTAPTTTDSSEARYTPGPWEARCRDVGYQGGVWSSDHFLQWEVEGPDEPPGRGTFHQADAYLVAAAPDLLAALQNLLGESPDGLGMTMTQRVNQAHAAIAKALGKD